METVLLILAGIAFIFWLISSAQLVGAIFGILIGFGGIFSTLLIAVILVAVGVYGAYFVLT